MSKPNECIACGGEGAVWLGYCADGYDEWLCEPCACRIILDWSKEHAPITVLEWAKHQRRRPHKTGDTR